MLAVAAFAVAAFAVAAFAVAAFAVAAFAVAAFAVADFRVVDLGCGALGVVPDFFAFSLVDVWRVFAGFAPPFGTMSFFVAPVAEPTTAEESERNGFLPIRLR